MRRIGSKKMLEAIARFEGWKYSEEYGVPELVGLDAMSDTLFDLGWLLEDFDGDGRKQTMEEKRRKLLDIYFGLGCAMPREAIVLATEVMA